MNGEELERRFSDIEIFLATFPDETTITVASVKLLAAILIAVEDAIDFFVKNQGTSIFNLSLLSSLTRLN